MGIILENSGAFPKNEKVLIDTNVLYWLTYASSRVFPKALTPQNYQLQDYPKLFEKLLENNNELFFSNYSVSELASIIARTEASLSGQGVEYQRKKWLREGRGREIVLRELTVVVDTVESWAVPLNTHPPLSTSDYLAKYAQVYLDGYDIYIENEISENKIGYILTDDIDFISVGNLKVITANQRAPRRYLI